MIQYLKDRKELNRLQRDITALNIYKTIVRYQKLSQFGLQDEEMTNETESHRKIIPSKSTNSNLNLKNAQF